MKEKGVKLRKKWAVSYQLSAFRKRWLVHERKAWLLSQGDWIATAFKPWDAHGI